MSKLKDKNVILFGPPGIGKSTIIKELIAKGYPAIDLEEVWPNEYRFELPHKLHHTIIGAADLDPKKYKDHIKILLYLPQSEYERRRAIRDKAQPGKGSQKPHNIEDWKKGVQYNYILKADSSAVAKIINLL